MTNKSQTNNISTILWLSIDFENVKGRIKTINKQIEKTLLKYESQEEFKHEEKEDLSPN